MQLALLLAIILTLVPVIFLLWTSLQIQVIMVFAMMHYSQVCIHPIIETSLISDICFPLRDMVTCGYFKKKLKDGFINDRRKFFKGFDGEYIKEGGKCS